MSIFSRKSKSKEREVKSKPPPPLPSINNGDRTDQSRGTSKGAKPPNVAASGSHKDGTPLSPVERVAERAALMAASRKRMNMDGADYSINGSFSNTSKSRTSHAAEEAARPVKISSKTNSRSKSSKAPSRTLLKAQKASDDGKKEGVSVSADAARQAYMPASGATQRSAPASIRNGVDRTQRRDNLLGDGLQQSVAPPMDSPTLGFTPGKAASADVGQSISKPSADSGYASLQQSSANNSRNGSYSNDARVTDMPRVDSPRLESGKESGMNASFRRNRNEDKSLIGPDTKLHSKVQGYVSRLDPGPTRSEFTAPVNTSKDEPSSDNTLTSVPWSKYNSDRRPSETSTVKDRGRSTAQKPVYSTAPSSPIYTGPRPAFTQAARSQSSSSRRQSETRPWDKPSAVEPARASPTVSSNAQNLMRTSQAETSSNMPITQYRSIPGSEGSPRPAPRFRDSSTLKALQGSESTPPPPSTSAFASAPLPSSSSSDKPSLQGSYSTGAATANQQAPIHNSDASLRRSTLPPVSSLQGFKVNKRGQVLDEEGDVIGELFEGDLIDCVRQRVNADGEVIDEFGGVVGRVRPIRRGQHQSVRYSEDSQPSSFHSGAFQRPNGSALPAERRGSNVSVLVSPFTPTYAPAQSMAGAFASRDMATPVAAPENTFIAELDASAEAEAYPVMDHSDIFIPTFGSSVRSQSPSQLVKAELPAVERTQSLVSNTTSNQDNVVTDPDQPKPKKWASRYFDQGPSEPNSPIATRRNSRSPATKPVATKPQSQPVSRRTSMASAKGPTEAPIRPPSTTAANGWNASAPFKGILGPTLEDLAEEPPSRSRSRSSQAGNRSTPNLIPDSSRLSVAQPSSPVGSRRASLQASSGGLNPNSARASYQPVRRSPLGSYETTPPGSGDANAAGANRSPSFRAAASVPQNINQDPEDAEDSAPAPEIPKARARAGKSANAAEALKSVEKRKSFFSFGRKQQATAVQ